MKPHLSRLDQIYTEQLFYFLTFCTYQRKPVLASPVLHGAFRQFGTIAALRGTFVGRYVIMPDHIHLFVAFSEQDQLSSWMKSLKNTLSKTLRAMQQSAPHWQKGYFDHLMRDEQSYGSEWEYVAQNPMRHHLVSKSSNWPYQGEITQLTFS